MTDQIGEGAANPRRVLHPDLAPEAQGEEPTPEPNAPDADNPQPERILVGGREQTIDEIVKNYERSTEEARRLQHELLQERATREAERRLQEERERVPAQPPQWTQSFDPEQLTAQDLQSVIQEESRRLFTQMLQEAMVPYAKIGEAQAKIRRADPDFDASDPTRYLNDPDDVATYNELQQTAPDAALRFAWKVAQASRTQAPASAAPKASQVAAGAAPQRPAPPSSEPDRRKTLAEALERAQETGDWESYYALRAKGTNIDRGAEIARLAG